MCKKLTTEEFIARAKDVHGDKYDYSKVNYVDTKTPVELICNTHNTHFHVTPSNHIDKRSGCRLCGNTKLSEYKLSNIDEFISKASKIHNHKYDYSKVKYVDSQTKIIIICPIHGEWLQKPNNHLRGKGCKACAVATKTKSLNEFIINASFKHNNKYGYSNIVDYVNGETHIDILCPTHGTFTQNASQHLYGYGCKQCMIDRKRIDINEFISRSNITHQNKYDYSKSVYTTIKKNIIIICPEHGEFKQIPHNHLIGHGCPKCSTISKGEDYISTFLTNSKISFESQKTFEGCKNVNILRFDFYLPTYNLLIEFDGLHHYKPIKYFGGVETYNKIQINDEIKNKFAIDNKIHLLRIKYNTNKSKIPNIILDYINLIESKRF